MVRNTSRFYIWNRIINKFNIAKLDYVLVGAAALVVHGMPRSTLDIDIYVPARKDILARLFQIAEGLGLESEHRGILKIGLSPKLFANQWICFSYKGQDVLDVFFTDENEYNKLYKNSELRRDRNIIVRVECINDLKAMKKASGRPQDLADIKLIEEARRYKN
mgnify:CR=1 FL=1